ncbi:hypothetical protein D3C83_13160 [compost metagenome]
MADVLPVAGARNIGKHAVPIMPALLDEGTDHVLGLVAAGRSPPQVLARTTVFRARGVAQPTLVRQALCPELRATCEPVVPGQARHSGAVALAVVFAQHALGESVVRRRALGGHAAGRSHGEQKPEQPGYATSHRHNPFLTRRS